MCSDRAPDYAADALLAATAMTQAYQPRSWSNQPSKQEEPLMSDQPSQDQDKIGRYLEVIEKRILGPIGDTEIRSYCTATLLLLFAAIDGLG